MCYFNYVELKDYYYNYVVYTGDMIHVNDQSLM